MSAGTGTQAVDRAAMLLDTVVRADEPLSFGDLHEECGLARSTTSRLLTALERTGLLERTDAGSYVAGSLFGLYATRHDPWLEVVRLAQPSMIRIGEETRETVHLSVARGGRVVQVAQVDSHYMLGSRDWSQVEVPDHCSALGKVLFAYGAVPLPGTPLEALTAASITDLTSLGRDLAGVRARGWASAVDELEEGLAAVAVPVRGASGEVFAALGISGPTQRLAASLVEVGQSLKDEADQLSALLRRTRDQGGSVAAKPTRSPHSTQNREGVA